MEIQGRIILALPRRSGESARGPWEAQDFVVETNDNFPRKMVFTVFGSDRLQRFNIQEGQEVVVSFDIEAHEYQGRWYNSVRAFDVRPFAQPQAAAPTADMPFPPAPGTPPIDANQTIPAAGTAQQQSSAASAPAAETEDDLPF